MASFGPAKALSGRTSAFEQKVLKTKPISPLTNSDNCVNKTKSQSFHFSRLFYLDRYPPNSRRLKFIQTNLRRKLAAFRFRYAPKKCIVVNADDIHFSFYSIRQAAHKKWFQFDYVLSFQVHYILFMVVWSIFFAVSFVWCVAHLRANNITSNQTKAKKNTSLQWKEDEFQVANIHKKKNCCL